MRILDKLTAKLLFMTLLSVVFSQTLWAQGNNSVTIRGDNEAPSVLYLVPWQQPSSPNENTDFEMDLDFEFSPLSRSEVIREVRYFKSLGYNTNSAGRK